MKIYFTGMIALFAVTSIIAQKYYLPQKKLTKESVGTYSNAAITALPFNGEEGKPRPSSIRADRDFRKRFTIGDKVTWFDLPDGFRAKLMLDQVETWVDYNIKGNWIHTIRIYDEKKMSYDLRHMVKTVYYDYSIKLVHEIELPADRVVYIVHLEGETELIDLRIADDEMNVLTRYVKSRN